MKTLVFIILFVLLAGSAGFLFLAQRSKSGTAQGIVEGRLAPCPSSPNCVSSEEGTPEDKYVAPIDLSSWDKTPVAIRLLGGNVTAQKDNYIAAEFSTKLLGFVDDLELRKSEDAIHIRSASRVGHSDMGVNRKRVEALRERLEEVAAVSESSTP